MAKRTNNILVCYLWLQKALSDLTVNKSRLTLKLSLFPTVYPNLI